MRVKMIKYRKALLQDINDMQALVLPEVESGAILERNSDEMATNIRSYIIALSDTKIVGFCALHIYTSSMAEVRSLIVSEELRGQAIGKNLIHKCIEEGRELGLKKLLSLTYKQSFFEKLGFIEISKESLPEHKIWADCIKCKYFPICNEVSLIKNL